MLHGLPAVSALRQMSPDCFIGWAIEPHWKALISVAGMTRRGPAMPFVDAVHEVRTRDWKRRPFSWSTLREIRVLRRELRAEHYDVCVDLQGSLRSAIIGRLSGTPRFLGPDAPRESLARMLYGERISVAGQHVIQQACTLLAATLNVPAMEASNVTLPVDEDAERWVESRLQALGLGAGERFVLLIPEAGWGAKQWPVERFRELARSLRAGGCRVLVNRSAQSAMPYGSWGEDASIVETTVAQLIALTRRVCLVVGGDTGPVHLAAALGIAVVALFGPTDPARNGPSFPGARVQVLRHAMSKTDHRRHHKTEAGLEQITVNEVLSAAMSLLHASESVMETR